MTWMNFLSTLSVVYILYYGINLLKDLYFNNRNKLANTKDQQAMEIHKEPPPRRIELKENSISKADYAEKVVTDSEFARMFPIPIVDSTGGVNFNELVSLINKEAIEYSKAIPY